MQHMMQSLNKLKQKYINRIKKSQEPCLVPRLPFSSRFSSRCARRFLDAARDASGEHSGGTFGERSGNTWGLSRKYSHIVLRKRETTLAWVVDDGRRLAKLQEESIPRG
jgi:hypothetical protein